MNKAVKSRIQWALALVIPLVIAMVAMYLPSWRGDKSGDDKIKEVNQSGIQAPAGLQLSVQVQSDWKYFFEQPIRNVADRNPGVLITAKADTGSNQAKLLRREPNAAEACDLLVLTPTDTRELAEAERLLPWDEARLKELVPEAAEFAGQTGDNFRRQGQLYACPWTESTMLLYVNYAHLAGSPLAGVNAFELSDAEAQKRLALPLYRVWAADLLLRTGGFRVLYEDDAKALKSDFSANWDALTEEAKVAFRALFNYWRETGAAESPFASPDKEIDAINRGFGGDGSLAFRLGSPADYAYYKSEVTNEGDLQAFPLSAATVGGRVLSGTRSGLGFVINARLKDQPEKLELIYQLIAELTDARRGPQMYEMTGAILGASAQSVFMDSALPEQAKDLIAAEKKSFADAKAETLSFQPLETAWREVLADWAQKVPADEKEAYERAGEKLRAAGVF